MIGREGITLALAFQRRANFRCMLIHIDSYPCPLPAICVQKMPGTTPHRSLCHATLPVKSSTRLNKGFVATLRHWSSRGMTATQSLLSSGKLN